MAISLFQWLLTGLVALVHPFYISVIDIQHNAKEKTVEVSVRIFTEDLETTLKKINNKADLLHPQDKTTNDILIRNYITSKLQLKIDGKDAPLHYLGHEQQQESTWCYFEILNVPSLKKIDASCSLLYDFETRQENIFHAKVNGTEKSYKLDYPKTNTGFEF